MKGVANIREPMAHGIAGRHTKDETCATWVHNVYSHEVVVRNCQRDTRSDEAEKVCQMIVKLETIM